MGQYIIGYVFYVIKIVFFYRPSIGDSFMTSESSCMTANSNVPVSVGCNSDSKASTIIEC